MSTHALVGHTTEDGAWRALWVHLDGAPGDLGARLVRAVELHGGDPAPVIEHLFSTIGWSAWPGDPHHPLDPDDVVFTPANVFYDFHWFYLFDVAARRLDVIPAGPDMTPQHRIHFGADGKPDVVLGASPLTLADLKPVWESWRRRAPAPIAAAFGGVLADLGVPEGPVGFGEQARPDHLMRELELGRHLVQLEAGSFRRKEELVVGATTTPLPPAADWFETRIPRWEAICKALGMDLEVVDSGELFRFRRVVENVVDARREMTVAEAQSLGAEFDLGDEMGQVVARAHLVWRWLFDQAWARSEGSDRS